MLIHAYMKLVLRCRKMSKFSFGMGLKVESGGGPEGHAHKHQKK